MFDFIAFSPSAVATPRGASPATIHAARLVLGFKVSLLLDQALRARAPRHQRRDLDGERERGGAVGHPKVETMAAHSALTQRARRSRSRMMDRTRASAVAIEYIQNANTMSSMPVSIATCIEVPVSFTL